MRLGSNFYILLVLYFLSLSSLIAEDKITTTPLINIDEIKPSFEESDGKNENIFSNRNLKKKRALLTLNLLKRF